MLSERTVLPARSISRISLIRLDCWLGKSSEERNEMVMIRLPLGSNCTPCTMSAALCGIAVGPDHVALKVGGEGLRVGGRVDGVPHLDARLRRAIGGDLDGRGHGRRAGGAGLVGVVEDGAILEHDVAAHVVGGVAQHAGHPNLHLAAGVDAVGGRCGDLPGVEAVVGGGAELDWRPCRARAGRRCTAPPEDFR